MKKALLLLLSLLGFSFTGCSKPPEQCNETIVSSTDAGLKAWNVVQKMQLDSLIRFDFPQRPTSLETIQIGQLLAAREVGEKAPEKQIDDAFLVAEVQKIHALETPDKRFFFGFHKSENKGFHVIQISIEWRVGEETSNTQKYQVTKTGYFNENGDLVCFWVHTPKT